MWQRAARQWSRVLSQECVERPVCMCTRRTGELLEMWVARRARRARRQSPRTLDHRREVDERRRRHAHAVASCKTVNALLVRFNRGTSTKLATLGKYEKMNVVKFTRCTILTHRRLWVFCSVTLACNRRSTLQRSSRYHCRRARAADDSNQLRDTRRWATSARSRSRLRR